MNTFRMTLATVVAAGTLIASAMQTAHAAAAQRIEPTQIGMGDSARLTITASGEDASTLSPPMVAGLQFVAVAQSQRIESINGISSASTTVTYQVIPQEAGVFTIPGAAPGAAPVVLTVNPGSGRGATASAGSAALATPSVPPGTLPAGTTRAAANGAAFVRLRLPKHELYVGETIPVDIQVGMRDGFVASLNGLPTLNGDAFTLNKLSSQPQRAEEMIDGRPYTVLTWHSALSAVKPGELALTIETPLTVRLRTAARPDVGEEDIDDLFNDPLIQNFFGASTEKDITAASAPTAFTVLALPAHDRPANFSGAVGNFSISSNVSDEKVAAGDPVTLRLRISGTGNFDRVTTPMLRDVEHWKTYSPTAKFKAENDIGDRGEKTFEQPLIATQPGAQSLPALTFSWFDPNSRRYVLARTSPLRVEVTPGSQGSSAAAGSQGSSTAAALAPATSTQTSASTAGDRDDHDLRPDHVDIGSTTASLMPHYYQPAYIGVPTLLLAAFSGAWFWMRRREQIILADSATANEFPQTESLLASMEEARAAGDTTLFFQTAQLALQGALATQWQVDPASITLAEVEVRLGAGSVTARVFKLADEAAYAGTTIAPADLQWWKHLVLREISNEAMS